MALLWLLLLLGLSISPLGVLVWVVTKHVLTADVPSTFKHTVKLRILDCSYHGLCNFLARETDSVVLCVGYRKLPGYHHPISYKDCWTATIHFPKGLRACGADSSRVMICGESTRAGFVAMVIQTLVGRTDLPQIRAQVPIYPVIQIMNFRLPSFLQYKNVPLLTEEVLMSFLCSYMAFDVSWHDAVLNGACIAPDFWKKPKKWLSSDTVPSGFKKRDQGLQVPEPFNESAFLETEQLFDIKHSPVLADDETIAQLPKAFLVSCEHDVFRDHSLLYKKRLEDQGVPVSWYHVEDGFHGCFFSFDKKPFSFPRSQKVMNVVLSYINGI